MADTSYTEDDIKTLDPVEHIRKRPGMYIGKLGTARRRMTASTFW